MIRRHDEGFLGASDEDRLAAMGREIHAERVELGEFEAAEISDGEAIDLALDAGGLPDDEDPDEGWWYGRRLRRWCRVSAPVVEWEDLDGRVFARVTIPGCGRYLSSFCAGLLDPPNSPLRAEGVVRVFRCEESRDVRFVASDDKRVESAISAAPPPAGWAWSDDTCTALVRVGGA